MNTSFLDCPSHKATTPNGIVISPWPLDQICGGSEQDSDLEIDEAQCKARDAEERALKERQKAGLPELELDQLPSSIAPKMMKLIEYQVTTCLVETGFISLWPVTFFCFVFSFFAGLIPILAKDMPGQEDGQIRERS